MPRYDYECLSCGNVFELRQGFDAEPMGVCRECGKTAKRKFHPVPVIYKGSGFYTTDYARNGDNVSSEKEDHTSKEKKHSDKDGSDKPKAKVAEEA